MKKALIVGLVIPLVFIAVGVIAEDKIPLEVRIKSLKGDVEIKMRGGSWEKAAQGMTLKQGTRISTGYGAETELQLADNSIVKVYQLTQITIDKFFRERVKVKTGINLKIGKIRAHVQKVGEELSDFSVVTPTSVVSVRGTGMDVAESDRGTNVRGLEHMLMVRDTLGRPELVGPGQETNVRPGDVPTSVVIESQKRARTDTAAIGLTIQEIQARQDVDIPEVKSGEPGETEVRQSDVPEPSVAPASTSGNGCSLP